MKIGVRLSRQFDDAGEYLADARALDAAGIDSLWLDDVGHEPWLLFAGIAAVTGRARLVAPVAEADELTMGVLRERLETLDRLSRGRAMLVLGSTANESRARAMIDVAHGVQRPVIVPVANEREARVAARLADGLLGVDESPEEFRALVASLAPGRDAGGVPGPFDLWASIKMPEDREGWRRVRAAYEAAGATGVIVPGDPRLLDLLRNGDEEDDRSDLGLAQG